jgi:hypothetical protein
MDGSKKSECNCLQISTVTHAIIIILLLFIIWKLVSAERLLGDYIGSGLPNQIYDSGATMRRLGQVFSSTDQGSSTYISNDEIKAAQRFP